MAEKMVSLELSKAERKDEYDGPSITSSGSDNKPRYPYGTRIDLDTITLEKLGLNLSDFTDEETVEIVATGKVTRLSINSEDGKVRQSMTIQLTEMRVDADKATKKKRAADKQLSILSGPAMDEDDED